MDASIWDHILTRIETKVNRHSFYTWFKPTSFVADAGSSIRMSFGLLSLVRAMATAWRWPPDITGAIRAA